MAGAALALACGSIVAGIANPTYRRRFNLMSLNLLLSGLYGIFAAVTTPERRLRAQAMLARIGTDSELGAAAAVSAMVGGRDPAVTLAAAADTFRALPFDQLSFADLANNEDTGLNARTRRVMLGHVDVFMSHSWRDSAVHKWEALGVYAAEHKAETGHELLLWLDKACQPV